MGGRVAAAARRERLVLLTPLLLVLVPFLLTPVVLGFLASLTNYGPAQLHWQFVRLSNYVTVLADREYLTAWRNIALFGLIAVPVELALGLGLASLLREPFRGRGFLRIALLAPWLVSPIANGVMWRFLLTAQTGIPNFLAAALGLPELPSPLASNALALPTTIATEVWRNAPLAGFLLLPGLLAIPQEQWEYATLEGAPVLVRLRDIALPWLRPLLLAVALLLVGDTLGTFDGILILTGGGPGSATVTPALYSYLQVFQFASWATGATAAWLIVAGMLLVGLLYLRLTPAEPAG